MLLPQPPEDRLDSGIQIRFSTHWDLLGPFQLGTRGMSRCEAQGVTS